MVTHLHGGENHPQFDGTPLQWFTRGGEKGPHYITNTFTYYNEQRASMVWYTTTRSATPARTSTRGLRASTSSATTRTRVRPDNPLGLPAGPYEIPLVLQDKTFNADGSMFYPTQGVTVSPAVGAGVLRRRRGRQRQDLAVRGRRAAPLPAPDRQRIPGSVLQPPVRRREQRQAVAVYPDRGRGRTAARARADDRAADRPRRARGS